MSKICQILLITITYVTTLEIYQEERTDYQTEYFRNLLTFYRGFDIIFHVDDLTYEYAKEFFNTEILSPQLLVYNHDQKDVLERPKGGDVLNVFFFRDVDKISRYIKGYKNISGRDVLMVITHNETLGKVMPTDLRIKHSHGAGNVLILNLTPENIEFFHICQYCGDNENHIMLVQRANTSKVVLNPSLIWPNTFRHFYGNKFTVLFNQYFPFMHCMTYEPTIHQNKTFNRCLKWVGSEGMLLETLSKTMNFTYQLIALTEYITVSKIIPYISRNKNIDFAIGGIGLSAPRIKKLLFTRMINYEKVVMMYKIHTGWKDTFFAFSNAFSLTIWCFVCITSLIISIGLFAFTKISYKRRHNLTFFDFLLVPPRIMIEQPVFAACLTKNIRTPVLIVLFCWMFGCIEFNTIYKSNLASQIIHPPVEKYRSVFSLMRKGYRIGMEKEKIPHLALFFNFKNPSQERAIKRKFFNVSVLCAAVPRVLKERIAVAGEKSFLEHHCQTVHKRSYAYEVNYTPAPLTVVTHGWLFRKGVPFVESFNENILRLQTSGLMAKWLRDTLWQRKRFFNSNDEESDGRVKLTEFTSHFTLYAIGFILSCMAFIYENIEYRIKLRRKIWWRRQKQKLKLPE